LALPGDDDREEDGPGVEEDVDGGGSQAGRVLVSDGTDDAAADAQEDVVDDALDGQDAEGEIVISGAAESAAASARPGMVTREGCASRVTRGRGASSSSLSTSPAHLL
jgi:hypothetical protein